MTEAHTGVSPLADLVRASRLPIPAERKRIRLAAGVSLEQVADALGVSHVSVSFWERGVYDPSTMEKAARYRALLDQLAKAAGTEIAEGVLMAAALRTLDEIWERGAADALAHPPMSQAKADRVAAILAPVRRQLAAREPQAA